MRFLNSTIDRDYCPYAYPAVMGTDYLGGGHCDIKPPLIHWIYKLYWPFAQLIPARLELRLRLLPYCGMLLVSLLLGINVSPLAGLTALILFHSPYLWTHMANTEWLTCVLLCGIFGNPIVAGLCLGLLPWANTKNVMLIPWYLLMVPVNPIAALIPSVLFSCYLISTGRGAKTWYWVVRVPMEMAKNRTHALNTSTRLLRASIFAIIPLVASMTTGMWAAGFALIVLMLVISKQVVPHHFILMIPFLAAGSEVTAWVGLAWLIMFLLRDIAFWVEPKLLYKMTFPLNDQIHYGMMLDDAEFVRDWLEKNTKPDDVIWVNGMENQIYLTANRRAWRMELPEYVGEVEGLPPEVVIHCMASAKGSDYRGNGYKLEGVSWKGFFSIYRRQSVS